MSLGQLLRDVLHFAADHPGRALATVVLVVGGLYFVHLFTRAGRK